MRKYHKKQFLDRINTLYEACETLEELQEDGRQQTFVNLCADSQEFCVSILEYLEKIAGENTRTSILLAELYELLFKVAQNQIDIKGLLELVHKISDCANIELEAKEIEVVFFCYKASMCDSLETVYFAAKEDTDCDAYFVPVPYYDRNSDYSLGEMHLEATGYYSDEYILTDWKKYDVEERHPDVIFVMNPYDNNNFVTCIHPNFFTKRLKKYCELLCYIPYFVSSNEVEYTDGLEAMCTNGGIIYSDYVFLQSESVKQAYIKAIKKTELEINKVGLFGDLDKKFIVYGHPKFDKILSAKRENYLIPEEWLPHLMGNKKNVFYNTTVSGILAGNKQYLNKLRSVLDLFRKCENVVLWWRPHPLSEQTYASMRRDLLDEYRTIVNEYREEGFGIYDDSSDLHRALTFSDMYFGDGSSSLVTLYEKTGKPMLIQDVNVMGGKYRACFENICDTKDYMWFTSMISNGLFYMDKKTFETKLAGFFPNEVMRLNRQYFFAIEVDSKLFFSPMAADSIAIYEVETGLFKTIYIPEPLTKRKVEYNPSLKFVQIFHKEKYLFFTPHTYPGILRYNMENGNIDVIDDWIEDIEPYITKENKSYFSRGLINGDVLYLACTGANAIFEFNLTTYVHRIYCFQNNNSGYNGICSDGNDLWLAPLNKGAVVRFNAGSRTTQEYSVMINDSDAIGVCSFNSICYCNGYIWIFPETGNYAKATKIDIHSGGISVADVFQEFIEKDQSSFSIFRMHKFLVAECIDNVIYAFSTVTNSLLIYDPYKDELQEREINVSKEEGGEIYSMIISEWKENGNAYNKNIHNFLYEAEAPVGSVIKHLSGLEVKERESLEQTKEIAGEQIYKYIKEKALL